jgi:hypothetical protein
MDMLDVGDLRWADCFVPGDNLKNAQGARALAETRCTFDSTDQREEGNDHRLHVALVRRHVTRVF